MVSTAREKTDALTGGGADQPARRGTRRASGPTRERLLAAARESFANRGYASTRVADIVALYTYFEDKRDALLALTEEAASAIYGAAVAPLANGNRQSPRDAIHARLTVFFRIYGEWWDVVRTWDHASAIHPEVDELRARIRASIVEQLCRVLARDRQRGHVDTGPDPEIAALALTAMVEEFASRWFALGRTLGTTEIDQLTALCAGALYGSEAPHDPTAR